MEKKPFVPHNPLNKVSADTRATLYQISNGNINLGHDKDVSILQQATDVATRGRKDRENNTAYDNYRRYETAMAVSDIVGFHYTEARTISDYGKINFNDEGTKEILKDLGYDRTNKLNNMVGGHEKIAAMQDLARREENFIKAYCPNGEFNIKKAEDKAKELLKSTNPLEIKEGEKLMTHIDNYRKTGLDKAKDASGGRRNVGRKMARNYVVGQDISRGMDFYKYSGKIGVATARVATKFVANSVVNLGTSVVGAKTIDIASGSISKMTGGKFRATNIYSNRKDIRHVKKDNISEHLRKKSRNEKILAKHKKKQVKLLKQEKALGKLTGKMARAQMGAVKGSFKYNALARGRDITKGGIGIIKFRRGFGENLKNTKVWKLGSKIRQTGHAIWKHNPMDLLERGLTWIKKRIMKYAALIFGGLLLIAMLPAIVGGAAGAAAGFLSFFLSMLNPAEKIADALDAPNYIQLIVNETAEQLGGSLQGALERDSETHFLSDAGKIPSGHGYNWSKSVGEADVTKIYSTEKGAVEGYELAGVSANLQPIVQMAHVRYMGQIGFDEYYNVKGYVYTMYVLSHDVLRDSAGNPVYSYSDLPECDKIYEGNIIWHEDTKTVTRPEELCENVYVHGYTPAMNSKMNKLKSDTRSFLKESVLKIFNATSNTGDVSNGVFVNEPPHDDTGVCTSYDTYKILTCDKGDTWEDTGEKDKDGNKIEKLHEHGDECYTTYYVCKGHCGGHISPEVTLVQDMSYENLAAHDNYVMGEWLGPENFNTGLLGRLLNKDPQFKTFDEWQASWESTIKSWKFAPFTRTPSQWLGFGTRKALGGLASLGRATKKDDVTKFEGWYKDDGSYTSSFKTLAEVYGTYYDKDGNVQEEPFAEGNVIWEVDDDNLHVDFPTGSGMVLSKSQIESILKQIGEADPSFAGSQREVVVEEALKEVGKWTYSLKGHSNGYRMTGGVTDCSGFVGGVIQRMTGKTMEGRSASGFRGDSTRVAGSAISHANGGTGKSGIAYTGHVVFYLGYLPEGIPGSYSFGGNVQAGPSEYVVECTSGDGFSGTIIKKMDGHSSYTSTSRYTQTYNFWQH